MSESNITEVEARLMSHEQVCAVRYEGINAADVPTDRTFRNAWEADFSAPDGHGLGHDAWAAQQPQEIAE